MKQPSTVYHNVELATGGSGAKYMSGSREEVNLVYDATWRGRPVTVRMEASRYVHSEGWSEWRIYADQAREVSEGLGANLTDTARHNLSDQHKADVEAWLNSKAYLASKRAAYVRAIVNLARDQRPYGNPPSRDLRLAIEVNADEIDRTESFRLLKIADAYDKFVSLLYPQ